MEPPLPGFYHYFRGEQCLAQAHNMVEVGFEPPTSRSGVPRSTTTQPPHSPRDLLHSVQNFKCIVDRVIIVMINAQHKCVMYDTIP